MFLVLSHMFLALYEVVFVAAARTAAASAGTEFVQV
jgi:hypothetical protein